MRLYRLESQKCVYKCMPLSGNELCAMTFGQNVAGMQVFSSTVGWLRPSGSNPGHKWVKTGSNMDHMWVMWVAWVMLKGLWVKWVLWITWATGQVNLYKMAVGATRFSQVVILGYKPV